MQKSFLMTFLVLLLSLGILAISLTQLDPFGPQRLIARAAFFFSLFTGVTSFLTFFFFFLAELITGVQAGTRMFISSMRRGVLCGLLVVSLLFLQSFRLLGLLEATLIVLFLALIEFFFLSYYK